MSFLDSFDFMPDLEGAAFGGADYGNYPTFSFDVPQAEVAPYWTDYANQVDRAYGGGYGPVPQSFDTTTGRFFDASGRPIDLEGAAFGGATYGNYPPTPPTPGLFSPGGALAKGGSVDQFLAGPVGRSLIPLLGGGASLLAGRAAAGTPPRLTLPPFTPSASTQAGENALLNAYGQGVGTSLPEALRLGIAGQRDIAGNIVRNVGAEGPYIDPVREAMQREILSVLSGGGVSPTTSLRQQRELAALKNQLFQQLGPDYALTTAGQDALNKLQQRHNAEQFDERRATVLGYAPQEQSRAQFAYAAPTARLGQEQNILQSIAPTQPLLNYGGIDRANLYNTQLQGQGALTTYQGQTQNQRELAAGIGQLGGKIAESIMRPPNPFDEYYRNLLAGSGAGVPTS